jgi:hypothetical protein
MLVVSVVTWHWVIVIIIYVGAGMLILQQIGYQVSAIQVPQISASKSDQFS